MSFFPSMGIAGQRILVSWELTPLLNWVPDRRDELRLLTTGGSLVSRALFSDAQPMGASDSLLHAQLEVQLPDFGGSYVVMFIDWKLQRKIHTSSLRVIGAEFNPPTLLQVLPGFPRPHPAESALQLSTDLLVGLRGDGEVCVYQEIRIDFDGALLNGLRDPRVCISVADMGDNLGLHGIAVGPYDHCARVVNVEGFVGTTSKCSVALLAPASPGVFTARLMTTPISTNLPYSVAVSKPFHVHLREAVPPDHGAIYGSLHADKSECEAGEWIAVTYDIQTPYLHLLSELDKLVFYPYGRSEAIEHHEGMYNAVSGLFAQKTVVLPCPLEEGLYDIGLYSFNEQEVVVRGPPIKVRAPHCSLRLDPTGFDIRPAVSKRSWSTATFLGRAQISTDSPIGCEPVDVAQRHLMAVVTFSITAHVFNPLDRLVVLDEGGGTCAAVPSPSRTTAHIPHSSVARRRLISRRFCFRGSSPSTTSRLSSTAFWRSWRRTSSSHNLIQLRDFRKKAAMPPKTTSTTPQGRSLCSHDSRMMCP